MPLCVCSGESCFTGRFRVVRSPLVEAMSPRGAEIGASCFTGALVIGITNPLDCLKQRWQVEPRETVHRTLGSFSRAIIEREGLWRGFWRPGLASNMCACTISVGTRLGLYPLLRDTLASTAASSSSTAPSGMSMFFSGLLGGATGYIAAAPFFAATRITQAEVGLVGADGLLTTGQRRGLPPTAAGSNSGIPMLVHLARERGVLGLWRASEVLVARGALMSATQLFTYDQTKKRLKAVSGMVDGPVVHCVASLVASLTLTTAICPLDVIYTAYLAGPSIGRPYSSPYACGASLVAEGGPVALFRGWVPLWMRFLPSSILTFLIYEQSRRVLLGSYLD